MQNFNQDLKVLQGFFLDLLDRKLSGTALTDKAYSFFGIQGPWYTVGWKMAVTIEREFGRPKLIECIRDERLLLETYNNAAAKANVGNSERLAVWDLRLIGAVSK